MKLYESLEVVPSRVLGVLRLVDHFCPRGLVESTAVELLQPKVLRSKRGSAEHSETQARENINAAIELGAIDRRTDNAGDERLFLSSDVTTAEGRLLPSQDLVRAVSRLALRPEVNEAPNLFSQTCAWFLLQAPWDMPQGHTALKDRMTSQGLDLDALGLRSDPRWDNVVYWMSFLGLIWQLKDEKCRGIVPDPTAYIRSHLDALVPSRGALDVAQFRTALGNLCPVLDGGAVSAQLLSRLGPRSDDRMSPALSLALRNLNEEGTLRYWCPDDQRTFALLSHDEKVAFISREPVQ